MNNKDIETFFLSIRHLISYFLSIVFIFNSQFSIFNSQLKIVTLPLGIIELKFLHMKQIHKIGLLFGCIFSLVWICGCSNESGPDPVPIVTISTDKTSIKANGKDKVVFSVTVDGKDQTLPIVIIQKATNTPVEGMSFSTDSVATYIFFATYNNVKSNEISIEAVDIEVILTANKQTVKANNKDVVTFIVTADGEDVTSKANIIQIEYPDSSIDNSEFFTIIPGIYTFYAIYNGIKSKEFKIDASAVVISLSVDNSSIKANYSDKATFTVEADGEKVTSDAVIKRIIGNNNDVPLENNVFFTDEADTYTFYAIYGDVKSNEVTVEAVYVELAFLKGYSIVQIASTTCANCPTMTEELEKFKKTYSGRIHVITLHPSGKYCNSELAGALAQTAINFVDKAKPTFNPPPLAIVDLYDPVGLQRRDTQTPLRKAIDRATLTRDRVSTTGIAMQSTTYGNEIVFEVSVKTVKTDNYRFFAFIVEDGVVHRQSVGGVINPNYIHNDLAICTLNDADPHFGVDLGTIKAGHATRRTFSIDTDHFQIGRNINIANCRIVCYTLRSNDGVNYFVDNVTSCPVNGSVHYHYER